MATPTLNPTPIDASAAPPATDRKTRQSLKYFVMFGVLGALSGLGFLKYRAVFSLPAQPRFFANNYLVWRMLADREIFTEPYKAVSPNAYDPDNKEWVAFIAQAQDNDGLLMTGHPEHFPRGQNKHYTLFIQPVRDIAAVFKDFCAPATRNIPDYDGFIAGTKSLQKNDYVTLKPDAITQRQIVNHFLSNKSAARILIAANQLLQHLRGIQNDADRIAASVPAKITDLCLNIARVSGLTVERGWMETQIIRIPQALAHLYVNYAISRMLVLFYLASLKADVNLFKDMEDKLKTLDTSSKAYTKLEADIKALKTDHTHRPRVVWMGIHRIITNAFPRSPNDFDKQINPFDSIINKLFGFKRIKDKDLAYTVDNGNAVADEIDNVCTDLLEQDADLGDALYNASNP